MGSGITCKDDAGWATKHGCPSKLETLMYSGCSGCSCFLFLKASLLEFLDLDDDWDLDRFRDCRASEVSTDLQRKEKACNFLVRIFLREKTGRTKIMCNSEREEEKDSFRSPR